MIEDGADAAPVVDPNSPVVASVEEDVVVDDSSDEDPNPGAIVVDDDDKLTCREDVLMLPNCPVTKLAVLELVSTFKLELTLF